MSVPDHPPAGAGEAKVVKAGSKARAKAGSKARARASTLDFRDRD